MNETELAKLKALADTDEPNAMFMYAQAIRPIDPKEADKYTVLAAQLGNPEAAEKLGDKYNEQGDYEHAALYYRIGAKAGLVDCAVKLAILHFDVDEYVAARELEELAESGVKSACAALAAYYKSKGNRKEYNFWRSLMK